MLKTLYEKFQYYSDKGNVRIIGDTHFGDEDMQIYLGYPQPWKLVKRINKGTKKGDTLIILGDIGDPEYVNRLKANRKVLIMGNHDAGISVYREYFDEIYQGPLMIAEKILLSHEPVYTDWCLNIHGHCHGGKPSADECHINVAADVVDYCPVNLKDIINSGALKKIDSLHRQAIDAQIKGVGAPYKK